MAGGFHAGLLKTHGRMKLAVMPDGLHAGLLKTHKAKGGA
jgi:hypothetical protein